LSENKKEIIIRDNDVVIFFDFRSDRARQITSAFVEDNFKEFNISKVKNFK